MTSDLKAEGLGLDASDSSYGKARLTDPMKHRRIPHKGRSCPRSGVVLFLAVWEPFCCL